MRRHGGGSPPVRVGRPYVLQPERFHAVQDGLCALIEWVRASERHVQVTGRKNAVTSRIVGRNEGGEVRYDSVDGGVRIADPPPRLDSRVPVYPASVHRDDNERIAAGGHNSRRRRCTDATDGELVLARDHHGRDLLEPFDLHPIREPYHHRPTVVKLGIGEPGVGVPVPPRPDGDAWVLGHPLGDVSHLL